MTSLSFLIINILNIQISIISQGQFLLFLLSNSTPLCFKKMNSLFFYILFYYYYYSCCFFYYLLREFMRHTHPLRFQSTRSNNTLGTGLFIYLFVDSSSLSYYQIQLIFFCSKIFMLLFFIFIFIVIYMIICVRKRSISNSCQIIHYDNQFIITHTMSR